MKPFNITSVSAELSPTDVETYPDTDQEAGKEQAKSVPPDDLKGKVLYYWNKIPKARCCNWCCCGYISFCLLLALIPIFVILDAVTIRYPVFETLYLRIDSATVQLALDDIYVNMTGHLEADILDHMHIHTTFDYLYSYLYFNDTNQKLTQSVKFDLKKAHNLPGFNHHTNLSFMLSATQMSRKVWTNVAYTYLKTPFLVPLVLFSTNGKVSVPTMFNTKLYAMLYCDLTLNGSELVTRNVISLEELGILSGLPPAPSSTPSPSAPLFSRRSHKRKQQPISKLGPFTSPPTPQVPFFTLPPTVRPPSPALTLAPTPAPPPLFTFPPTPSGSPFNISLSQQFQVLSQVLQRIILYTYTIPVVAQNCQYGLTNLTFF
ncbi:hypothetical protein RFI_14449 [Reticulomyxa filosa]|uniref:Uncharacterized protein n=1 Tax=Reticulomyxa filosa TaxID=46433 RepID=X6NAE8_RETFI|nr:hypothetical protein RFI_14449 [Reticulomyxa filosa]|eukprot:ETO22744.1 hypothetical protein RFI_14449 [Reticulomyxa filosa]